MAEESLAEVMAKITNPEYNPTIGQEEGLDAQGAAVIDHATRICESYQLLTTPQPQQNTFVRISSASIAPVQNAFMRLIEENKDWIYWMKCRRFVQYSTVFIGLCMITALLCMVVIL